MTTDPYYTRFGALPPQLSLPPSPDTNLIIVIPCYNEPNLIASLEALWNCERPACAVEIITVINSSADAPLEVLQQNQQTLEQAQRWAMPRQNSRFTFHFIHTPSLPPRQAGVGYARKIGMDEAARRLDALGRPQGVLVCFDADSLCDPNYLRAIEHHFAQHPRTPGCSIYFEHPLSGDLPPAVYDAIALYELHLRYYVQALRFAGFPYAFHTIGSSMAVRSQVYKKQGGMNKRQAGEDFYFLQKIIPWGEFTDLTSTRVIPSPRSSARVPFGTGKAVSDYLENGELKTYPWEAFLDLRSFLSKLAAEGRKTFRSISGLPPSIAAYLEQQDFSKAIQEIESNTTSDAAFHKRFFQWFNGFQVMKFVHFARDTVYSSRPVGTEAARLLELTGTPQIPDASTQALLFTYRKLDREQGMGAEPTL